jgi:sensor histidine kinase YesM
VGLANIRERLQLLYGSKATLSVRENPGGGTAVSVTVPYKSIEGGSA